MVIGIGFTGGPEINRSLTEDELLFFLDDRTKYYSSYKADQYPEKTHRETKQAAKNDGQGRLPLDCSPPPSRLHLISNSLAYNSRF